jgi:Flp pilus assembly protein TadG
MLASLRSERGQDLVEYAIVFTLLMLLLIGIIESGIAILAYNSVANAAREGARYGVIRAQRDDGPGIEAAARRSTMGLDQSALAIASTVTVSNTSQFIEVDVDYDHAFMTPLMGLIAQAATGSPTLHLRTTASMRVE